MLLFPPMIKTVEFLAEIATKREIWFLNVLVTIIVHYFCNSYIDLIVNTYRIDLFVIFSRNVTEDSLKRKPLFDSE